MASKGRSSGRGSSRRPDPNPLKVAHMVSDAIEMAPRIAIPLQILIGARDWNTVLTPLNEDTGVIDVLNTEDGHEYQILVIRKSKPADESTSTSSRLLTTPTEGSNESSVRESGSSSSS